MARIVRPELLRGTCVNLREVTVDDAAFILKLRTSHKARFLHHTDNNLQKQIDYIKRYLTLDDEWYFIVERKSREPIGTWRIYNVRRKPDGGAEFEPGSWVMLPGSTARETMEGMLLAYGYAYDALGLTECVGTVLKSNRRLVNYYRRLAGGAMPAEERGDVYVYRSNRADYLYMKDMFASLLE